MDTVLITGGTGLVGRALTEMLLEKGYKVIVLSRRPRRSNHPGLRYAQWDLHRKTLDTTALQEADHIVHLAGANVAEGRWTERRKQEIVDSRVQSGQLLYERLSDTPNKVRKVISASATGYYGPYKDEIFREDDPPAHDFLGTTSRAWEDSIRQTERLGKKVIVFRTGIVLSLQGGALREFYKPLKLGFATVMGDGQQWVSWIHLQDLVRLYFNAIVNDRLSGVYNAVAPNPVTNEELVMALARAAKGKSFVSVHIPAFALKLALGEMSIEVLKSVRVSSEKIQETGFLFSYPEVSGAVEQILQQHK
ncbi:TIGR01777 family oxidoreductase [Chitinophaga cymbidii]|uniref:NAD-dependent epimerase n=1 Tax=Chitinophaga cymbidii TaxID=1096750 RepID=A0A512RJ74_9BACT|nr:TIGR01777 family oxidoreductase [Chitinophaga cymbidii]GEP95730.1 NAD-dependent epimerase [Chitinophaga cymbidii]